MREGGIDVNSSQVLRFLSGDLGRVCGFLQRRRPGRQERSADRSDAWAVVAHRIGYSGSIDCAQDLVSRAEKRHDWRNV